MKLTRKFLTLVSVQPPTAHRAASSSQSFCLQAEVTGQELDGSMTVEGVKHSPILSALFRMNQDSEFFKGNFILQ